MKFRPLIIIFLLYCCIATVFANNDDSFKKIQTKGKLVIGLDETFAPMEFKDKSGQVVGFDIDLATAVTKRLNIKVVFQPCVWDSIFFELKNANIDAIWNGLTINKERREKALFSKPYMTNNVVFLVNKTSNLKNWLI